MRGMRLVVVAAVALLALSSGVALADSEHSSLGSDPSTSSAPPVEVQADRTKTSQTFSLPDGQLETRIYPVPINYRDEEGNWQPINEDLQEEGASAFANGQNSFDLALPEQLDGGAIRVSTKDGWISSQLLGADTQAAEVESNSASYEA